MVDAAAPVEAVVHQETAAPGLDVAVHRHPEDALRAYAAALPDTLQAPPQSAGWVAAWLSETRPECLIAVLSRDGRPELALALEIVREGPCRVARFMGGRHANGNFPAVRRGAEIGSDGIAALIAGILRAAPDVDMIAFERLYESLDGAPNPLLQLPHRQSPNVSLAADLAGGFEALLGRVGGRRKRKKARSQARRFEEAGGYRRFAASSSDDTNRLLDAFFSMKEERFREMGIANVFGPADVQAFFRRLFADAIDQVPPPFVLHGLEVGGRLRAVTGASRRHDSLVCEFGSIAADELAAASPGSFLFFLNIEEACQQGFRLYDFSVGDEPYKRLWCEVEIAHFDVLIPLTARGRVIGLWKAVESRAKAALKGSPAVWRLAKRLRRRVQAAERSGTGATGG